MGVEQCSKINREYLGSIILEFSDLDEVEPKYFAQKKFVLFSYLILFITLILYVEVFGNRKQFHSHYSNQKIVC